jgi:hypothetical protein
LIQLIGLHSSVSRVYSPVIRIRGGATSWMAEEAEFESRRTKNFLFLTSFRPALGPTQPPIQLVPGVKWPGREADHSLPTVAEVKKMWIYAPTSPYVIR